MVKINYFCSFVLAVWISIVKAELYHEIFSIMAESINNQANHEMKSSESERDMLIEDDDDEDSKYLKVVIHEAAGFRAALRNKDRIWENGVVPFEISGDYRKKDKNFIFEAMQEFRNKTCVRFRKRKNEKSYISIMPGRGCSAVVGKIADRVNRVNLHRNCFMKGIVLHELMHTLGFFHEQNRPDRDEYVTVVYNNIRNGAERNFEKYSLNNMQTFNLTYDYDSVMHYGAFDFAKNRSSPTIIPLQNVEIGQRKGFSESDLKKINLLYDCARKNDDGQEINQDDDEDGDEKDDDDYDDEEKKKKKVQ